MRLLRALCSLTPITRTIHTNPFHDSWARFAHSRLLLVQYTQACCAIVRAPRTLTVITRTIYTSLLCDCWERFVHSRLLLLQYTQACCAMVESASHTYGYYSYNTHKAVVRLLRALRTLTLITCTIHTSLLCDCWERFAVSRLLLVQYIQACSTIVERASHTHAYYSYNSHKPVARLLRTLHHTSLLCDCWERFAHSRLLLVQYTQACCAIVETASYTHGYYSYNTRKPVGRLLRALRTVTVITRTIHASLLGDCLERFVQSRLLFVQYTLVCEKK